METMSKARVVRTIEGLVALCLGETARVVWVNQANAAAFTDGDKIYLPAPTGGDPQEYALLLAIALREVAKAQYCDTKAVALAEERIRPFGTAIEEARLKEEIGKPYKGAHEIFQTAFNAVVDILCGRLQGVDASVDVAAHAAIWAKAQSSYLRTPASQDGTLRLQDAAHCLGIEAEKLDVAMLLSSRAATAESTVAAMEIGRKLWALLQQEQSDSEEGSDASQESEMPDQAEGAESAADAGQDTSDSGASQADGQASQQDGGQPSTTQADQKSGAPSDGQQSPADANADGSGDAAATSGAGASQPMPSRDVLSDALSMLRGFDKSQDISSQAQELSNQGDAQPAELSEQELQALAEALSKEAGAVEGLLTAVSDSGSAGDDEAAVITAEPGAGGELASTFGNAGNSLLSGVQGRLVTVFQREFQECTRKPILFKQSGQRVAASQVWKFQRLGNTKIFLPKSQTSGIDTAVKILLDRSDSMESGMKEASKVTFALAVALQRIAGVQVSIDVFPGVVGASSEMLAFKQNALRVQKRLEQLIADGGTPMGSALLSGIKQLEANRCAKKFVLVITDGKPNANELPLTKLMLKHAEAQGMTAIGIGIGQAANVDELFSQFIKVDSVNELAWAFETLFKGGLMAKMAA